MAEYEPLQMEIILFDNTDVIRTSIPGPGPGPGEGDFG